MMRGKAEQALELYLMKRDYKSAMISWAVEVMCAGGGGESTTLLAGADHEDDESVVSLFRKAAVEQGVFLPGPEGEFGLMERWVCRQLVQGRMDPREGMMHLFNIWMANPFDERLARWLYLSESIVLLEEEICGGLEPFETMTLDTVNETILREAKAVVDAGRDEVASTPPLQG